PINAEINILYVRFPRILGAGLAGMGLSLSGIIFQSILKNPMAEPYTLGVSSGAALGAALSIILPVSIPLLPVIYKTPLFALTGAVLSAISVIFISGNSNNTNKLILFGISFNFFLSALLTLAISFNRQKSSDIIFWTLGSFTTMNYFKIILILLFLIIAIVISLILAKELNLFTLGETTAKTLGLNIKKYRIILLATASILTGIIVAFSGIIGFVGLIIPHLIRIYTGSENKRVISIAVPIGGIFLIICDTIARVVIENELPVGAITSLVGAPLFIYLLRKGRSSWG
ncbi:MAG: iron ABC transporter permease, partial [Spirochaetales bacterium]|nr:iron ABC transporter permease [Spirochaetales bacterium]